jgi:lipid A 4'-phosphatase
MGIGVVSGLMIGLARIAVGAHWLSDVLWAFPVTLVASGLVWLFLSRIYNTRSR